MLYEIWGPRSSLLSSNIRFTHSVTVTCLCVATTSPPSASIADTFRSTPSISTQIRLHFMGQRAQQDLNLRCVNALCVLATPLQQRVHGLGTFTRVIEVHAVKYMLHVSESNRFFLHMIAVKAAIHRYGGGGTPDGLSRRYMEPQYLKPTIPSVPRKATGMWACVGHTMKLRYSCRRTITCYWV